MKTSWLSGVKDAGVKKELRANYIASKMVRERLTEMLDTKLSSSVRASRSSESYDSPNWALKQADATGYQRALEEVKSLLEDAKKESLK